MSWAELIIASMTAAGFLLRGVAAMTRVLLDLVRLHAQRERRHA